MDKYENMDNFRRRKHTVEVTLQNGEYKGKLRTEVFGNCFGLDILRFADDNIIYDIEDWECVDCKIELLEDECGEQWFRYILKDKNGDECEGEDECGYFSRLVVGINIVGCEIVEEE